MYSGHLVSQDNPTDILTAKEQQAKAASWMDSILSLIPGRKQTHSNEPSDEAIRRTHDYLRLVCTRAVLTSVVRVNRASPRWVRRQGQATAAACAGICSPPSPCSPGAQGPGEGGHLLQRGGGRDGAADAGRVLGALPRRLLRPVRGVSRGQGATTPETCEHGPLTLTQHLHVAVSVEICCSLTPGCSHAMQTVGLCLAGFVSAIRITSLLDMGMLRNTCAFDHSELQTSRQADLI